MPHTRIKKLPLSSLREGARGPQGKKQRPLPERPLFLEREKGVERKRSIENKKRRLGGSAVRLAFL